MMKKVKYCVRTTYWTNNWSEFGEDVEFATKEEAINFAKKYSTYECIEVEQNSFVCNGTQCSVFSNKTGECVWSN